MRHDVAHACDHPNLSETRFSEFGRDDTLYSHYSTISTVEGNWGLDNLGRGDVNTTLANVFNFVARAIGFENTQTPQSAEPKTNVYGAVPGPLSPSQWIPFTAPPVNSSRFGGKTMIKPGLDWTITAGSVGQPLMLSYDVSRFGLGKGDYNLPLRSLSFYHLTTQRIPAGGVGNIVYTPYNFTTGMSNRYVIPAPSSSGYPLLDDP